MRPSLFDCVTGQGWLLDQCNRGLYIDGISNRLGNCRYRVLRTDGSKSLLQLTPSRFSFLPTVLKLALFCTLIFPLFMLILKHRNLNGRQFHVQTSQKNAPAEVKLVKRPMPVPKVDFLPIPIRPAAVPTPLALPRNQLPEMAAWPAAKAMEPTRPREQSPQIAEPASLRSTAKAFAEILDGWKKLAEEVSPLSDSDIERKWSLFQAKVSDLLENTPVDKAIDAYRALRHNFPNSSLFPSFTLKDAKGNSITVDRFLAVYASPVLAAACRSCMKESHDRSYSSSLFDEGLLKPTAAFIQQGEEPRLNLKQLMGFYKTCDLLQMSCLESCRRKLCLRLLYDRTLKFEELLALWTMAEAHSDGSLRFCCLQHLGSCGIEYALPPSLDQSFALFQHWRPFLKQIDIGEQGKVSLTVSSLNREQIEGYQRLGIERLTVKSLFDVACAQAFQSITSLTLAIPHARIDGTLISSLFRQGSSLRKLKIGYATLDDDAAQALMSSLGHLNSLALLAVGISQKGMQALASGLQTNRSLAFLQMSHGTLDDHKWQLVSRSLQQNAFLKGLCISDNRLSPDPSANFLTKIMQSA